MVGALNKLPVAASGMMFFGDAVTFPSVSAIFTGFVAGLVYAAAKSAQSAKAKRQLLSSVPDDLLETKMLIRSLSLVMASGPLDLGKPR